MPHMSPLRTAVRLFAKLWTRDSSILLGGYEETAVAAEAGMLADLLVD